MTTSTFLQHLVRQLRHSTDARLAATPSDAELLQRFHQQHDANALETIVHRHGRGVLSACRKVLSSEADVEDAFQATFMVLIQHGDGIRAGQALGAWLACVAHRVALRALENARRRQRVEQSQPPAAAAAPDLSWREACAILHEELDRLPDKYRLPLILCYLNGVSRDEAAEQLGMTPGALRGWLQRGRELLRRRLTKRGIALSAGLLAVLATSTSSAAPPARLIHAAVGAALGDASPGVAALVHGAASTLRWKFLTFAVALLVGAGLVGGVAASRSPRPAQPMMAAPVAVSASVAPKADDPVTVRGTVRGPDGKPVAGARVYFDARQTAAVTRDDGTFTLTIPAAAPRVALPDHEGQQGVVLLARADGYGPDWTTAPLDGGAVVLHLVEDDVPLEGRLLDLEGKPVAGVRVEVHRVSAPVKDELTVALTAWLEGHSPASRQVSPLRDLPPAFTALFNAAETDAKGRFRLTGIGRDRLVGCTLRGAAIEQTRILAITRQRFTLPEDAKPARKVYAAAFDHVVLPGMTLSGVVRERGTRRPLAGITVRDQKTGVEAKSDERGRYELRGVSKQSKSPVFAVPPDGSTWFTTSVLVADEPGLGPLRADFELQRGVAFRGKVTDPEGKPVAAWVHYYPISPNPHVGAAPGGDRFNGFETVSVRTRADGSFTVALLPGPGAVLVSPDRPGFQSALVEPKKFFSADPRRTEYDFGDRDNLTVQLSGGGATQLPQEDYAAIVLVNPAADAGPLSQGITLKPARPITGEVVDADGKPVKGARMRGLTSNGDAWQVHSGAEFTVINWNPARPRRVEVWHPERQLVGVAELRDDGQRLRVQLQSSATVTGRVVNEDGKPWTGVMVFASGAVPGDSTLGPISPGTVMVDREGRFRVEGLIPGLEYTLFGRTIRPPLADGHLAIKVLLPAGETKNLGDLRFKKSK